jgi:hypothetical protein
MREDISGQTAGSGERGGIPEKWAALRRDDAAQA